MRSTSALPTIGPTLALAMLPTMARGDGLSGIVRAPRDHVRERLHGLLDRGRETLECRQHAVSHACRDGVQLVLEDLGFALGRVHRTTGFSFTTSSDTLPENFASNASIFAMPAAPPPAARYSFSRGSTVFVPSEDLNILFIFSVSPFVFLMAFLMMVNGSKKDPSAAVYVTSLASNALRRAGVLSVVTNAATAREASAADVAPPVWRASCASAQLDDGIANIPLEEASTPTDSG